MNWTKRIIMALMLLVSQAGFADIITDFEGHPLLALYEGLQAPSIETEATKFCTDFGYNRMENFQTILSNTPMDAWAANYDGQGMKLISVSGYYRYFHFIECK